MNATEAKRISDEFHIKNRSEYFQIKKLISQLAAKGCYSVIIKIDDNDIKDQLKREGFKLGVIFGYSPKMVVGWGDKLFSFLNK